MSGTELLAELEQQYTDLSFTVGDDFMWSPAAQEVHYEPKALDNSGGAYSLLHELAHALLKHENYITDTELIQLEMQAWSKAKELAAEHQLEIPEDHIQDCLDSYRDWLLKRATCPDCSVAGLQSAPTLKYECPNCAKKWTVTADQTCTPQRRSAD